MKLRVTTTAMERVAVGSGLRDVLLIRLIMCRTGRITNITGNQ